MVNGGVIGLRFCIGFLDMILLLYVSIYLCCDDNSCYDDDGDGNCFYYYHYYDLLSAWIRNALDFHKRD